VARQFSTGTKFGSEKGKVQKPARIPPQTSLLAGGKKAEAGQFHLLQILVSKRVLPLIKSMNERRHSDWSSVHLILVLIIVCSIKTNL